jgi:hypothetical protein
MRTKKPWVRFLLTTDGWYVRFMSFSRVNRKTRHYKAFGRACQAYFTFLLVDKFQLAL